MRGMKKWLPFKSLNGQYEVIRRMEKERTLVSKPELGQDEIAEMDQRLRALKRGDNVSVTYFEEGEIKTESFQFLRLDPLARTVSFRERSLSFAALLKIE